MNEEQLNYLKTWVMRTKSDAVVTGESMMPEILNNLTELEKWLNNIKSHSTPPLKKRNKSMKASNDGLVHLDLFSGIGGFAYAVDQVFAGARHIFCEIDPFCKQVLNKHWPESEIIDDIRQIDTDTISKGLEGRRQKQTTGQRGQPDRNGQDQELRPFILTGGFPCQPFSAAGLRRGDADERHLWPEMLRVIRLTKPQWVIAENVRGLLTWSEGLVFEQVCLDLEAEGYEVQPLIIPAVAVNAPHRRDRIWFIAHRNDPRGRTPASGNEQNGSAISQERQYALDGVSGYGSDATDTKGKQNNPTEPSRLYAKPSISSGGSRSNASDSRHQRQKKQEQQTAGDEQYSWSRNWLEVATELCGVDDGLPAELDGFELTKPKHRQERLKSLGNAVVPQVAIEIMKGML